MNNLFNLNRPGKEVITELFQRHLLAFNSGEVDAVLSDFDADSVVITAEGVFQGLDQIRVVYQNLLAEFGVIQRGDSPGFTIDILLPHENTLFVNWHAESQHLVFPFGSDTFVVDDGKIRLQTITYSKPLQN